MFLPPELPAEGSMQIRSIAYEDQGAGLLGHYACPDTALRQQPAVLVMPPGSGLGKQTKVVVERLAAMGYCALGGDPFGGGAVATNYEEAETFAALFRHEPDRFRARAAASLHALAAQPEVDARRIAAIGYCMGGSFVLELARSGADLVSVVSFHGILTPKRLAEKGAVKAEVLVCTGAQDPFAPLSDVTAFAEEMTQAGATWQVISYAGAQHSFTNPDAGAYNRPGLAYDRHADQHSWAAMEALLARTLRR
jgi:dienelactone hydrolase